MKIIIEFIPIVILLLFLSFSNYFIELAHTSLGKLLAVSIIIFYARINKHIGLFICFVVISFYYITNPVLCSIENLESSIMDDFEKQMNKEIVTEEQVELDKEKENNKKVIEEKKLDIQAQEVKQNKEQQMAREKEESKQKKFERAKYILKNKDNMPKKVVKKAEKIMEESLMDEDTQVKNAEEFTVYTNKYENELNLLKGFNGKI